MSKSKRALLLVLRGFGEFELGNVSIILLFSLYEKWYNWKDFARAGQGINGFIAQLCIR